MNGAGTVNWTFFQKPTNTSERVSPLLQLTSLNSEVILRELSNDYRVDFKMMQNKRLVETQVSGYRLQFLGYMLQINLGKPCQNISSSNIWRMLDWFYAPIESVFDDV